jgi:hypothetical protein
MTTATPSTALATIQPAFTDPERLALAGFLAGYRGATTARQESSWPSSLAAPIRQRGTSCRFPAAARGARSKCGT